MSSFETLCHLDEMLVAAGHHPLTPFWADAWSRFYQHPTARVAVARVGRGGAKSFNASKFAVNEVLFGDFGVPPGERHYLAFVSVREQEALERLRLLESFLRALGEPFERRGDTIELGRLARGFKVFACNVGSVSGFRCLGYVGDEAAKWRNSEGAHNAGEVLASIRAMTVTHTNARGAVISSAFSVVDHHYELMDRGATADQVTFEAPTWVANPSITEEHTHRLEPNERVWKREYAGIPQGAISQAWDTDDVLRAFGPKPEGYRDTSRTLVLDMSSGGDDPTAFACFSWLYGPRVSEFLTRQRYLGQDLYVEEFVRDEKGEPVADPEYQATRKPPRLRVAAIGQIKDARARGFSGADVVAWLARKVCQPAGILSVVADQHLAFLLEPEFKRYGIYFRSFPWTAPTKQAAVERVRRWLADGTLSIAEEGDHVELRRQLLQYDERLSKSGAVTYSGRGSTHDDLAALLVTAAIADSEDALSTSPYAAPRSQYHLQNLPPA